MAISGMFSRAASLEADRVTEVWNSIKFDAYLHNPWNQLDFVIVLVSWLNLLLSSVKFLKVLRLGRTLRPLRLMSKAPTMQKVIITLVAALPPVGAVIMLTGFIFLIFGILGLGLFRGMYMYCDDQYSGDISGKDDCRGIFQFDSYGWTDSGYSLDGAWGI